MYFCREFSLLIYTNSADLIQKELIYLSEANYLSQINRGIEPRCPKCQQMHLSHQSENSCQALKSLSSSISLLVTSILVMNFRSFLFPSNLGQSTEKKEN